MKFIIVILSSLLVLPAVCAAQESDLAGEVRELRAKLERLEKKRRMKKPRKQKKPRLKGSRSPNKLRRT
jgi:outer membrane murein-binding lipoprotein Lpp